MVALTKTVHRGEQLSTHDLTAVRVGDTSGVPTVQSEKLSSMVGEVASYDLVKGSLLSPTSVGADPPPGAGRGVIGVKVSQGRAPEGYLEPNTPVRLVVLPSRGAAASAGGATDPGSTKKAKSAAGAESTDHAAAGAATGEATKSHPVISAKVLNATKVDGGLLLNVELKSKQAVRAASYAAQDRVAVVRDSER